MGKIQTIIIRYILPAMLPAALFSCKTAYTSLGSPTASEKLETQMAFSDHKAVSSQKEIAVIRMQPAQVQFEQGLPERPAMRPSAQKILKLKQKAIEKTTENIAAVGSAISLSKASMKANRIYEDTTPAPAVRVIDWVGILSLGLVLAAYLTFFLFHAPILAAGLVVAGIIASVHSLRRCDDKSKYKGKGFAIAAGILGGIGFILLLILAVVLGVAVSQYNK